MQKIKRISLIIFIITFIWLASDHENTFKSGDIVECKKGSIVTLNDYYLCKSDVIKTVSGIILFNWNYVTVHVPNDHGGGRGSNITLHKDSLNLVYRPTKHPTRYLSID